MDFTREPLAQSETVATATAAEVDSGNESGGSRLNKLITDTEFEVIGVPGRDAAPRARTRRELDRKPG